ncbi:hypothetical protein [Solemya velum gill symbiont]|uniref:hypothetical protein n=1 Tax=Solemya velum gill symbiont TaxID=2340 RepID=UPI00099886B8|nr:hypothetical protein [Solemya velum gill symbiont]OOY53760.1 hypothetical protein BOV97_00625 [Solemya velum gill symbiont]OOY57558.1 hypothetical protein BOV99_00680 [Solemya velum gill symbiont]OOY58582.1 hypothetical protein BOW00_00680 [Solemya velum gill symbiont]OOY61218.1 hypothetical protein BOW02_02160 [Solemya velum gill symbiont]OOY62747.1 hypothetical protein BOW04_03765 [Solemya velum gill symbiont]
MNVQDSIITIGSCCSPKQDPGLTKSRRRKLKNSISQFLRITITATLLLFAGPASAKDLLDWVIEAVDPTLLPARPLIECLAGGGSAAACATEAAEKQVPGVIPIGPEDDRIKKAVAVFDAARKEHWMDVVTIGGEVVAKTVSCAVLPVQGPAKQPACNIIGWVIANNVSVIDKAYGVLKGPDWWGVVELLGPGVCTFIPGDGVAGTAKDLVCGTFGQILRGAKEMADKVAQGVVAGVDALENLIFGDDSHMPYDTYYALYWQPWYHYATALVLVLNGQSLGPISSKIWHPCVDYFDSHNQYRSTARKTCDDMRDKRFNPEVHAFARALPIAVDGYFDTVARPAIRAAVLASFGKPSAQDLPGQKFFVQNCAFQVRKRFPFPEPTDARCRLLRDKGKQIPHFKALFDQLADECYADIKTQDVQPTVWTRACEGMEPRYAQEFASESLRLIIQLGDLKNRGCVSPGKEEAAKSGLAVTCDNFPGHTHCLSIFRRDGRKYCRVDVPPITVPSFPKGPSQTIPMPGNKTPITIPKPGKEFGGSIIPGGKKQQQPQQTIPLPAKPPASIIPVPAAKPEAIKAPKIIKPVFTGKQIPKRATAVTIEAETLTMLNKSFLRGGKVVVQYMKRFGNSWSGGKQLFWSGGKKKSTLDLNVTVPQAGKWKVEIYLTKAPDYGKLKFNVNGKSAKVKFDGYARRVSGPVKLDLGAFTLKAGSNQIRLTISGKNKASTGYLAGIDWIRLVQK